MELTFNTLKERRPMSLQTLADHIGIVESHDRPDIITNLSDLKMNDDLNIVVPSEGNYALTPWSRRQIANLLGFKFDKWFENADNAEKAFELNRRFNRATGQIKLRTTDMTDANADGTLKAFVSPTYSAVSDSMLSNLILHSVQQNDCQIPVIRANFTDKTLSYAIRIGDPYESLSSSAVGTIWGGILIQNSGVGYASLSISLHLMRLVCTNGMTAPVAGATLLRRRHSGRPEADLWNQISHVLSAVPEKLGYAVHALRESQNKKVANAQAAIEAIIKQAYMPSKLVEPLMLAYNKEPYETAFAVAQAVTDFETHEQLGLSPEDRKQLEDAAAEYIANAA
ncbi:MAG: hypothetical protein CVV42_17350 [Candidatus Riflebacteria bacterium HGW-Riflebacteria-2]|jgi:hypothetical protein|nr:MAG: hypothetical protein CVV42_17350 [Candidatus Riflebacteria bacterium HGW-Riflebacteria-2]